MAVGIKGFARKTGCAGCFLLFRRPAINGCKSKLLFKPPATAKSAATCSLPCGGGLGRGHSPNRSNLFQHPNHPNTSLAACYPLSNSLPRGERTGWLLGLRIPQGKRVCSLLFFCFSDGLLNAQFRQPVSYYFQNTIKISHLLPCRLLFQFLQHAQDFCQHIVCLLHNFVIPKTQHGKA